MTRRIGITVLTQLVCIGAFCLFGASQTAPAATDVGVALNISNARPRQVENQTEQRITADYRLAWANLAAAMDSGSLAPLDGLFVGPARESLAGSVSGQHQSQISTRYLGQKHNLQAVFYSPEGDLIELQDTAEYQMQVFSSGKLIHDDRGVHRYVVLMTPASDRWVIRQLVEVTKF
ncbi:MAG TPA: hypothetical protein VKV39_20105 [Candidatus Sulfotelmatobacter sp.]|nr:hypothetical protein [Candidatus Sulfotelmatobacter sp.]